MINWSEGIEVFISNFMSMQMLILTWAYMYYAKQLCNFIIMVYVR